MKRNLFIILFVLNVVIGAALLRQSDAATAQRDRDTHTGEPVQDNARQICFPDMYEPNDSCGAAASLGPGYYTPLYVCTGDNDWFAVDVPAGHKVEVNSYFTHSGNSDLELSLFDPTCSVQLDSSSTVNDNESVSYQATTGATYYVRSFGWDAADEGAYELEIKTSCDDCFTYQGQLQDAGSPANGDYEFLFQLYDAVTAGNNVGGPITRTLTLTNGLFTTQLYFGDPSTYTGEFPLFVQVDVRPAGSGGAFTGLSPRQELTAAPFAHTLVAGAVVSGSLPFDAAITARNAANGGIGLHVADTGDDGVQVTNSGGYGVYVINPGFSGFYANSSGSDGVYVSSPGDDGVQVFNPNDEGFYVSGAGGTGVYVSSADQYGVYGRSVDAGYYGGYFLNAADSGSGDGNGLYASGNTNAAADIALGGSTGRIEAFGSSTTDIYLDSNDSVIARVDRDSTSSSAYFGVINSGNTFPFYVYESGNAYFSGNVSKAGGSFMIDHPLDPENKLLYHSFVESPDMMNIYNGNAELDENGTAWVELPDWFGALNRDYRYQLTPIGAPGPNLYIAAPVADNRFQIAGGAPGMTVSWQVTGIRQDPFAEANRIPVEVDKPADQQGTYLHPEAWGQPPALQYTPLPLETIDPEVEGEALEGADEPYEQPDEEEN